MKIRTIYLNNQTYAFEICSALISLKDLFRLLIIVDCITNLKRRKLFQNFEDSIHIKFVYKEQEFIVQEPYGDSSEYWIGPYDETAQSTSIAEIESVFVSYKPTFWRRMISFLLC